MVCVGRNFDGISINSGGCRKILENSRKLLGNHRCTNHSRQTVSCDSAARGNLRLAQPRAGKRRDCRRLPPSRHGFPPPVTGAGAANDVPSPPALLRDGGAAAAQAGGPEDTKAG